MAIAQWYQSDTKRAKRFSVYKKRRHFHFHKESFCLIDAWLSKPAVKQKPRLAPGKLFDLLTRVQSEENFPKLTFVSSIEIISFLGKKLSPSG